MRFEFALLGLLAGLWGSSYLFIKVALGAAIHGKRLSHLPPAVTAAATMMLATLCLVPASLVIDRPWNLEPSARPGPY